MDLPSGPMLNVGSGPCDEAAWVNIDGSWQARMAAHPWISRAAARLTGVEVGHWPRGVRYRDVRRGLDYSDGAVAAVYSSHMLEHLYRDEALRFLREAHRVLAPGGVCRIVVPDVEMIVQWYLRHQREPVESHREPSSDLLMGLLLLRPKSSANGGGPIGRLRRHTDLHQHKWMYDREGLVAFFREAGFASPAARGFLDSDIPRTALERVEHRDRVCDGAGVCVEARR
jgi:SAM-dependent methyltransferase